jgi:predicted transcriptional regulator
MTQATTALYKGVATGLGICTNIGPLEADVLRALCAVGRPAVAGEVCGRAALAGYFAYQRVLNCLNRLAVKGFIERTPAEPAHLYRPCVDMIELAAAIAVDVIDRLGVDRDRVVCRLLGLYPDRDAPKIARLRAETGVLALDPHVAGLLTHITRPRRG